MKKTMNKLDYLREDIENLKKLGGDRFEAASLEYANSTVNRLIGEIEWMLKEQKRRISNE